MFLGTYSHLGVLGSVWGREPGTRPALLAAEQAGCGPTESWGITCDLTTLDSIWGNQASAVTQLEQFSLTFFTFRCKCQASTVSSVIEKNHCSWCLPPREPGSGDRATPGLAGHCQDSRGRHTSRTQHSLFIILAQFTVGKTQPHSRDLEKGPTHPALA